MLFQRVAIFVFSLLVVENLCVLEMVMERCEVKFVNASYFKEIKFSVRKYSRNSKRYLNALVINMKPLGKNIMVELSMQEYLHNEYRPTFVRWDFKLCDLLESPYMRLKEKYRLPCPMPPMEYTLPNITIYAELLPEAFPFEQGRILVRGFIPKPPTELAMGYLYVTFIKKPKHKNAS